MPHPEGASRTDRARITRRVRKPRSLRVYYSSTERGRWRIQAARLRHHVAGLVVGEFGPVCAVFWREAVDRPRFEMQAEGLGSIAAAYPSKAAFVCVIEEACTPPDDEMRRASIDMIQRHAPQLSCMAAVIEGTGFRPSIARSILSGMNLVWRSPTPRGFFGDVRDAAPWLERHTALRAPDLLDAFKNFRAALG